MDKATCGRFIACIVAACVFYYVIGPPEEERPVNKITFMLGSKIIDPEEASTLISDRAELVEYHDGSMTIFLHFKERPHDDVKTPELNDLALPDTTLPGTDERFTLSSSTIHLPIKPRRL